MRILVTGGAGFIGSHTCDRLVELGHEVIVLDALTAPVHRDGRPNYLTPGVELFVGDVRNRELLANLLRRVDAVYHFAAYQDYLPGLRPVHRRQRRLHRADLRDRRGRGARPAARSWSPPRSRPWGRGCTAAPSDGEQTPGHAARVGAAAGRWELPLPDVRRPAGDAADAGADLEPAERLRDVQVRRGDGRAQPRPPLRHPDGGAALQHRAGAPAVGLQRLLRGVPDLLPALPARRRADRSTRTARPIRDYVNIHDVVDANVLVLTDERRRRPGVQRRRRHALHDRGVRRDRPRALRLRPSRPAVTGEYRFGDTRHICSDIDALKELGWAPRAHAGGLGGRVRRVAEGHAGPGRRARARRTRRCARSASSGRRRREGLPARRRPRHPAASAHRHGAEVPGARSAAGRCWTSGSTPWPRPASTRCCVNTHHLADQVRRARRPAGPPARRSGSLHEPTLLGSAGTLRANRRLRRGRGPLFLAINADNLTDFDLGGLVDAHHGGGAVATLAVFQHPQPVRVRHRRGRRDGVVVGFEEKPAHPRGDLANAGLYAFDPRCST